MRDRFVDSQSLAEHAHQVVVDLVARQRQFRQLTKLDHAF